MTSTSRQKPYSMCNQTWKTILDNLNIIPMNNRQYEWPVKEINKFMNDIFQIFEKTNYPESMGKIIYYTGNPDGKEVYEGQQRTITITLVLVAISKIAQLINDQKFSDIVISNLSEDPVMINKPHKIFDKLIDKYGENIKLPKVFCIWPGDNDALIDIYNHYEPLICYYNSKISEKTTECCNDEESDEDNDDEDDDDDDNDERGNGFDYYTCIHCSTIITRKSDLRRHLVKKHNYIDKMNNNTKIYTAYEYICEYIFRKKYNSNKLKELYKFIIHSIDIQVCECWDPEYVAMLFDQENNRGIKVGTLDVIKNNILSNIEDDKKEELYNIWTELKSSKSDDKNVYSNYGKRIFSCAIQIYNKQIHREDKEQELFDRLIMKDNKDNTYKNVKLFFNIVKKLFEIINEIKNDRWGRLIFTKKCCIAWEGYMFLLLPIFYFKQSIDRNLIHLIVKWYYRSVGQKVLTFNSVSYSEKFIEISNKYINDRTYNYYDKVVELFRKEKPECVKFENYVNSYIDKEWKKSSATKAKMLLFFYLTKLNCDDNLPNFNHDLEHIHSDNKKNSLMRPNNVYKLGNLTILEAKKSENGHKGNRSIKDRPYNEKRIQYEMSSNVITRDIAKKYENFTETVIIERTRELFKHLNELTDY